jgi:SSS family solute:Na+ symporter
MNIILFIIIASLFGIMYVILGLRASKNVKTDTDYFVAGRSLGVWQITANLIATQLGGGMVLGTAMDSYKHGFYGIFYTIGMSIGFLLLAAGIASRLQQFKVTTTAQLFETQYGSPMLKQIASLLSIITLFGILIAQVVGFKSLLAGVGLTSILFVAIFWLSVVGYTMIGGLRAITINDIVQLGIITFVFSCVFLYSLATDNQPFFSLMKAQKVFSETDISFYSLFPIILMPALFSLIQQDLAQRFFASKSKAVATISAFNAGIFLILFAIIPVYFGMKARLLNIELPEHANPLIIFLQNHTNDLVFSFVLCAIIAAIISTADALMNAVTANITQDFKVAQNLGISNHLLLSKIITFVVGTAALIMSYYVSQNIINIIISSYELSVSCLLVPLLFCYFKKEVKKEAAFGAIILGFLGFFIFRFIPTPLPKEIMALGASLIGYLICSKVNN